MYNKARVQGFNIKSSKTVKNFENHAILTSKKSKFK